MSDLGHREWEAIMISFSVVLLITFLCTVCACLSERPERDFELGQRGHTAPPIVVEETLPEDGHRDKSQEPVQPKRHVGADHGQQDRAHLQEIHKFK